MYCEICDILFMWVGKYFSLCVDEESFVFNFESNTRLIRQLKKKRWTFCGVCLFQVYINSMFVKCSEIYSYFRRAFDQLTLLVHFQNVYVC